MSYREAASLATLHAEINKAAPNRDRAADGWIGDADHAARTSDHNPWVKDANGVGVVRARDWTHDPAGGLDCAVLAGFLASRLGEHPALGSGAYVIWRSRIISTDRIREGWRTYTGPNPHAHHLHLSVGVAGYDSTSPWGWPESKRLPARIRRAVAELDREIVRVRAARDVARARGEKPAPYAATIRAIRAARKAARQVPKR